MSTFEQMEHQNNYNLNMQYKIKLSSPNTWCKGNTLASEEVS